MQFWETVAIAVGVIVYDKVVAPAVRQTLAGFEGAALVVKRDTCNGCGNGCVCKAGNSGRSQVVAQLKMPPTRYRG